MKLGTPMVRCCLPIEHAARRSKLAGYDRILCSALVFDTPELRAEHARDIHGSDDGVYSAPVEDCGYSPRTSGRDWCPCGKRKSEQLDACADCIKTERQSRHIVRVVVDDCDHAERQAALRDEREEQGLCRSCGKDEPMREGLKTCRACRESRDIGKRRQAG